MLQVVAAGRRRFFYVYHLASGRVERVARIQGMDEERSLETFAASPAQGFGPELAFLGNGVRNLPVEVDVAGIVRPLARSRSLQQGLAAQASSSLIPERAVLAVCDVVCMDTAIRSFGKSSNKRHTARMHVGDA